MLLSFVYLKSDPRPRLFSHVYPPVCLIQSSNPPVGSRLYPGCTFGTCKPFNTPTAHSPTVALNPFPSILLPTPPPKPCRINSLQKCRGEGGTSTLVRTGHIPDRIDREHP